VVFKVKRQWRSGRRLAWLAGAWAVLAWCGAVAADPPPLALPELPNVPPVVAPTTPPASATAAPVTATLGNPFATANSARESPPIQLVGGPPTLPTLPPPKEITPVPGLGPPTPVMPGVLGGGTGDKAYTIRPRSLFQELEIRNFALSSGETAVVVRPGVILTITNADGHGGIVDIEAEQLVFWTQGTPQQVLENLQTSKDQKNRSLEFYLAGNVEIRTQSAKETRILRADDVYYDVNRHVAIANNAELEMRDPKLLAPIHMKSDRVLQLNADLFEAAKGVFNGSSLPSDPEVSLTATKVRLEMRQVVKRNIFGFEVIDRKTGQPIVETEKIVTGYNLFLWYESVPVFYWPILWGNAEDPLGPLRNVSIGYNRIFGFEIFTSWDMYSLIGTTPLPGTHWRLHADGFTDRGPALGTDFTAEGKDLFGIPNRYTAWVKAYGIYDTSPDIIGGGRGQEILVFPGISEPVTHPDWRGRFTGRVNIQDLPGWFTLQSQVSVISDHNFLEQYFAHEYQNEPDQNTYLYAKQQHDNWAWTFLVEPRIRDWVTETEALPRVDGYLLGAKIFDLVTYEAKASAGYYQLRTTNQPDFAYLATDKDVDTGRFDLFQEVDIPFRTGPVNWVPYGVLDLTYYTQDLAGNDQGRVYGAGGVRTSMPLSHLYSDVSSELFNLDTIYHKIMLHGNFYTAWSNVRYSQLPQLDQFNDNASDQAIRDMFPQNLSNNPAIAQNMLTTRIFDPQMYALRRLVLDNIDTRDDMEVLQLGIDQRWQTKRGFPGNEHIIDWMTLNLSASLFPRPDRDNFGAAAAFLEYDWTWNIGDRTSLVSTGWIDPISNGPRVFSIGANFNRPDNTNFFLSYRQIDPLNSRAVIGAFTYTLSQKYSVTASASFDFGIQQQVTSLVLTRTGKDLRVSFGISYNSILNTFGFVFDVVPTLMPQPIRGPAVPGQFMSASGGGI
jgi:hypothetical protein